MRRNVPQGARIGLLVAAVAGVTIGALAWVQVQRERRNDEDDLDRRAHAIAHQMAPAAREALAQSDQTAAKMIDERFDGYRRLIGFAIYRSDGQALAAGDSVAEFSTDIEPQVQRVVQTKSEASVILRLRGMLLHVLASPLKEPDGGLQGVLVVLHDMSFIEQRAATRLVQFGFWILVIVMLMVALVMGATWVTYERPMHRLAEWMQRVRVDDAPGAPPKDLPVALLATESNRLAASFRAARLTGVRRPKASRDPNSWTRERLRAHAIECLEGRQLVVVSNREPFMHNFKNGSPQVIVPAGGLVTALDPVLQAVGGTWVAHGSGDADRQTADSNGRLKVPPGKGRYTLRRVWMTREEEQGYYYGLSNEGLWPLCHLAHERPMFRESDWREYQRVNQRFADAVVEETGSAPATVLVQDYQLALVPGMLKALRPDFQIGIFWHIPWPNPEAFRICPWRADILQGMLGADVIGFHLQQYCNNFLDTVDRMVEARLDWDHFAAEVKGHTAVVRPFPISIEPWNERNTTSGEALAKQIAEFREVHKLGDTRIVVGVERIDYTKGLLERLRAFSRFLDKYPQYRGKLTFVLLAAPSRTHLRRYRELVANIESAGDEINWKFQTDNWKPLRLLIDHHDSVKVHAFLSMADVCVVSSLHDGMNLVAKEYVAAKPDGDGALVLSEFAGAARELTEALLINPYDTEQFADAIERAFSMPDDERRQRMRVMQTTVRENNVYRWAGALLAALRTTQGVARSSGPEAASAVPVVGFNGT